jgi:hypothetical protein
MMDPLGFSVVIPSRLGMGEEFTLKIKVLGKVYQAPLKSAWCTPKPALGSPFNHNVYREFRYLDNCLPEWDGTVRLDGGNGLSGPDEITFAEMMPNPSARLVPAGNRPASGTRGAFPGDPRPIREVPGLRFTRPGFHFIRVYDPVSGCEGWSNPVYVSETQPQERIYWGDPHWQSFFTDGLRIPEEMYQFARYEAFLDFGALSDHSEGLTDRMWEYFIGVTNDYNLDGEFVSLVGQEWTHHIAEDGAPGHRNVYFKGDEGPILRCTDPHYNSLEKLWRALENIEAIAIPHHSANKIMGVDWSQGWNPRYETAVEIYSVWGNSEMPAGPDNPQAIVTTGGEVTGRHVIDALLRGYRMGFVGGGDIHDGRPGDCLTESSLFPNHDQVYGQGLTAVYVPDLSRSAVYEALKGRKTYAASCKRIYLETEDAQDSAGTITCRIRGASEEGIRTADLVLNGEIVHRIRPEGDPRIVETAVTLNAVPEDGFVYWRLRTGRDNFAWSSPVWKDEII